MELRLQVVRQSGYWPLGLDYKLLNYFESLCDFAQLQYVSAYGVSVMCADIRYWLYCNGD
jgi:hypothetical protein